MTQLPVEKPIVIKRLEGISAELKELHDLAHQNLSDFTSGSGWKLAQFHLHRALEGVFNICSHILSRIPGGTATQYKEIAKKMGEFKLVPEEFANTQLVEMAKYRNRLVHFYAEVTPVELYKLLNEDLGDLDTFMSAIKEVLENPQDYDLLVE